MLGCSGPKNMIVLVPDETGAVGSIEVTNQKGAMTLDAPNEALFIKDDRSLPQAAQKLPPSEADAAFRDALAIQPKTPVHFILQFEFDSTSLTRASKEVLDQVIEEIRKGDSRDILITGHTDRSGEKEYNLELSLKRAQHVRDLLIAAGVAAEYLQTTSYGEGYPLVPTADNVVEPKNRRVEIVVR